MLGDGGNLLGGNGNLLSITGGSSMTTVAQKCQWAMEIQVSLYRRTYGRTNGRTDMDRC